MPHQTSGIHDRVGVDIAPLAQATVDGHDGAARVRTPLPQSTTRKRVTLRNDVVIDISRVDLNNTPASSSSIEPTRKTVAAIGRGKVLLLCCGP